MSELAEEFAVPYETIRSWRNKENWDIEEQKHAKILKDLAKTLEFFCDPSTEKKALAEANLDLLLRIQGVAFSKIQFSLLNDETPNGLVDSIQKLAASLEKAVNSKNKLDTDGVQKTEVTHVHQVDMDQALELALESKRKGQTVSIGDAAQALAEQQKLKNAKSN